MKKLCLYFNIPSLYRRAVYQSIDKNFNCKWFFDDTSNSIKQFDLSCLSESYRLKVINIGPFYLTLGLLKLLKEDCSCYIMIGATRNLSLYLFLLVKKLFYRDKRVILWSHGMYGKESWLEWYVFKKPMLKMADSLLLYGNYSRELLIKAGFPHKRLFTIHNSLDYAEQLKLRSLMDKTTIYSSYFGNDFPTIIFIGRLTKVKKLDQLLNAVSELKLRGRNFNVVLVGEGEVKQELVDLSGALSLNDSIWFYGECYDERENAELIYNADICVSPGNVGLTAIHSLMFGCPVITHDDFKWQMPEFEAVIPYETGNFFIKDDVKSLVQTIEEWFDANAVAREVVRSRCYLEIDTQWNPDFQMSVIDNALKSLD